MDSRVDTGDGGQHLGIVQQRGFLERGLELVHEINQPARAVNERHPDFRAHLLRRRLDPRIADVRTFDTVPDDLFATRPLHQSLDALRDELEFACHLRLVMHDGIDVERGDVAALDVFGVILRMIAADAAAYVVVPCHALAEIQQHRTRGVGGAHPLIVAHDFLRQNGRTVALALAE